MDKLRIASSDPLSTFHQQAEALGAILVEEGVADEAEVLTTTGSVMNAEMVARGAAEIGFMASNWVPRAVAGAEPFAAPASVAVAAPLNAGPIFFVARADSELEAVAELRGRRVAVGHRDSGMAQHALNLSRTFGWGENGMDYVYVSTFDGGKALAEGAVDAQLQAPIPSTHFTELCRQTPIKVLDYAPDEVDVVCGAIPFYSPSTVPSAYVPGLEADKGAVGVLNVIVTAADGDREFTRNLVRAYIRRAGDLAGRNPLFRGLGALLGAARERGKAALAPDDAPLHPGAADAFREEGLLR